MDKKKIIKYLADNGIMYAHAGFKYLIDVIEIATNINGRLCLDTVYKEVSEKHCCSKTSVEKCIRDAINKADEYMTNKEFVAKAVYELKYEIE